MFPQQPVHRTTRRLGAIVAALAVLALTSSCAGSQGEGPLRVELEPNESFVSAAPSGSYLLTRLGESLCLRSGSKYLQRECATAEAGSGDWYPTWSPDEQYVALVRAGSSRHGESNDSIWVLDVRDHSAAAVSPTDQWLAGTPIPYWIGTDRVGYFWPNGPDTQIRVSDLQHGEIVIAEYHDFTVESVLATDDGATLVCANSGRQRGVFRLRPDGDPELVIRLGKEDLVLATDRQGERIVTQLSDVHSTTQVQLVELASGAETELFPSGAPLMRLDFSSDGRTLFAASSSSARTYSLATYDIATAAEVSDPITVHVPKRSALYSGIFWTKTAIMLPFSSDGEAQVVLVFAVTT